MACEDETLYRLTTNQPSNSACVTAAECIDTAINAFGDRTCNLREMTVPTVTTNNCSRGEFLDSSGNCVGKYVCTIM